MSKTVYRIRSIIIALAMACTIYTSAYASFTNTSVVSATTGCIINVPVQDTTIQAAVNAAASGCTINVAAGNFPEKVTVNKPVSIIGAGNNTTQAKGFVVTGSNVVIKNFYLTGVDYGIYSTGPSGDFENNHIYSESQGGIQLSLGSNGSKVANNKMDHDGHFGIKVNSNSNLIQGNEISYIEQCPPAFCNPDADGIYFFGANNTYAGNYIHDINYSDPYNVSPHIDCFQTWNSPGISGVTTIKNNVCYNSNASDAINTGAYTSGFTINNGGSGTLIITGNIIRTFIGIGEFSDFPAALNIQITNNTFIGDSWVPANVGASALFLSYANNISQFSNNLIIGKPQGIDINKGASVTGSHNWFYDAGTKESFVGYSPANDTVNIDPLMQANYSLAPNSPACGAGAIPCGSSAIVAPSQTPTSTLVPPTFTSTPIIPASSPTASPASALPTFTSTPIISASSPTASPTSALLTFTSTPIIPTASPTASPTLVLPTFTSTPIIPIASPTASPTPALPTFTSMPIAPRSSPTASSVPVLPSATPKILPTATSKATTQPVSEKIYNDTYHYLRFSSFWPLVSNSQAYKDEYKYTDRISSSVKLTFTGRSFSILYTSGPDYGKMDIYIDNRLVGSLNQNSPDL
ncbi:MAG TPA: hypothetical protein VIN60_09775, partial [Anaerolineales bacterium]